MQLNVFLLTGTDGQKRLLASKAPMWNTFAHMRKFVTFLFYLFPWRHRMLRHLQRWWSEMVFDYLCISFFYTKAHCKIVLMLLNDSCFQEILCDVLWGRTAFLLVFWFCYLFRLKTYLESCRYKVILFWLFFSGLSCLLVSFFVPNSLLSKTVLSRNIFFFVFYLPLHIICIRYMHLNLGVCIVDWNLL